MTHRLLKETFSIPNIIPGIQDSEFNFDYQANLSGCILTDRTAQLSEQV